MARTTGTAESPGRAKSQTKTAREVAVEILRQKGGGPMKVTELAKLVVKSPKTNLGGKTPEATVAAHIYTAAKAGLLFKKTGRGEVQLLPDAGKKAPAAKEKAAAAGKSSKASGMAASGNGAAAASSGQKKGPPASDDVTAGDRRALGETPAPDDDDGGEDEAPAAADRELAGAAH